MLRPPFPRLWLAVNIMGVGSDLHQIAAQATDWTTWVSLAFNAPVLVFWLCGIYREWEQA